MSSTYTASVLHGAKDLRLEERQLDVPASNELQILIKATGLCGSDVHYYHQYRNGDIQVQAPLSLGHESAGVVCQVGPDAEGFEVGDHVALEVGIPCGTCDRCNEGRYNLCKSMKFRSSAKSFPHFQGTLQERINHPADWCHKLPKEMSFAIGALIEPLSVAMQAIRRAQLASLSKSSVFILGAGAIGLLCAAMCKVAGVVDIEIADIQSDRVQFATDNGYATAGLTIPMRKATAVEDNLVAAKEIATHACKLQSKIFEGFDVVFECTGVEACSQTAIYATRPGGKVVLVGMGNPVQALPISAATLREVDILGTFRYANTYPEAIRLLATEPSLLSHLQTLITHTFNGLAEAENAFQMASKTQDEYGKLVLKVIVIDGQSK